MNGAGELTERRLAMQNNEKALLEVMEEADKLRLETLKELLKLLSQSKTADFLTLISCLPVPFIYFGQQ